MERKRININEKQSVGYVIPSWLRDLQIKLSIERVKARIAPYHNPQQGRPELLAVVGYGPSLRDTWEKIKEFPFVMSCSGSHRFLIERGIIPNWHVAVDPLPQNTVRLIGQPHADVEYLIASTCHPDVFDHLENYRVTLWHVLDNSEEGKRLLPRGEYAVTGGCDVGLRCLTLGAFLGFRDIHVFGLDGSAGPESQRHAAEHPSKKQNYCETEVNGKIFLTTPAMAEAARQTLHEMKQLPKVKFTFYGEGLTQELVRSYKPENIEDVPEAWVNTIGYIQPELISAEYLTLNQRLHRDNLAYGVGGGKHAPIVLKIAETLKTTSILDYGCGKGFLAKAIPFPIWEYDPAITGKAEAPRPADIVVCTDVLEHIEPDKLFWVLNDLARCIRNVGYLVIHTGPAVKSLADGRNTHLIQKPKQWWKKRLRKFFTIGKIWEVGPELNIVVGVKLAKRQKEPAMQCVQEVEVMA